MQKDNAKKAKVEEKIQVEITEAENCFFVSGDASFDLSVHFSSILLLFLFLFSTNGDKASSKLSEIWNSWMDYPK